MELQYKFPRIPWGIITVLTTAGGLFLTYYGIFTDAELKISGARMGPGASSFFFVLFGLILMGATSTFAIRLISSLKFKDEKFRVSDDEIHILQSTWFKGYSRISAPMDNVTYCNIDKGTYGPEITLSVNGEIVVLSTDILANEEHKRLPEVTLYIRARMASKAK